MENVRTVPVFGLTLLAIAAVGVAVAFDIAWYVAIDGCTMEQAFGQLVRHHWLPPVCG